MSTENTSPLTPAPARQPLRGSKASWFAWLILIVAIMVVAATAMHQQLQKHRVTEPPPVLGILPDFALPADNGTTVTLDDMKGRIWVADFIFTRCGGQCPLMTSNMRKLQTWLEKNEFGNVKLVSVSVDPEGDTPQVLKEYGALFKADTERWRFLTGPKPDVYSLITNGFKLGLEDNQDNQVPDAEAFIHSNRFVLVDSAGNIRGYFTPEEEAEMVKLQDAIKRISNEPTTRAPEKKTN